ncbi:MAG: hypothetical protein LBQ05_01690 [Christensenellaceae bacterium]|jgi:hypothetical protein|nr:hypothetical protein [Christensenellaceae bacterium]
MAVSVKKGSTKMTSETKTFSKYFSLVVVSAIIFFGALALTACGCSAGKLGNLPALPTEFATYEEYINYLKNNQATQTAVRAAGEWEYEYENTAEHDLFAYPGYRLNGVWVGDKQQYYDSTGGKYIVNGTEYESGDFEYVNSEYVDAVRTIDERIVFTFNDDGTFIMYDYRHTFHTDFDESYTERIYPGEIDGIFESFVGGTYTVDGDEVHIVVTANGERGTDGEIEWTEVTGSGSEIIAYLTINDRIYIDDFFFNKVQIQ